MDIEKYYFSEVGNISLSEHFHLKEFLSKNVQNGFPYCDEILISHDLIDYLEQIFSHFNCTKAIICDGYREPGSYCQAIGGMSKDAHACGIAADVIFYNEDGIIPGEFICCYAEDLGMGGIGFMGRSVHLDVRHLGGYKNSHWWGDETTNRNNITSWWDYFNIDKNEIYSEEEENTVEDNTTSNSICEIDGGEMLNKSKEQLVYEVNRLALTLFGREIGNAEDYAELLANGTYSWYDVSSELQECPEGIKHWIKTELYLNILGKVPADSEIEWWYTVYASTPITKAEMVEGFTNNYEALFNKYSK